MAGGEPIGCLEARRASQRTDRLPASVLTCNLRVHPDQIRLEAEGLLKDGALPAALQRLEDLIRLAPDDSRNWTAYGKALNVSKRIAPAIDALRRASELAPDDWECRTTLGGIFENISRVPEAIHWHGQALALAPDSLALRLNHACIWPGLAESRQQIDHCRERLLRAFTQIQQDPGIFLHPDHTASNHTFGLAYHGIDDRAWLEDYARLLIRHLVGDDSWDLLPGTGQRRPPRSGRHRLGFLSAYFYGHSNARAFEGLLRGLDRDRFELVLIHLHGSRDDAVRRRLDAGVDQVVHCPRNIAHSWEQLQALDLDLLFITDVGMNPELYGLLCRRVAPVQVTGWGYPRTSGFPTIDYYLSGDLVEPANAQEHYSETLVRLTGLPCRYLSDDLPVEPLAEAIGRAYFLLPEEAPLVGCLQTFWKLHPDFDAVLEQIARAVPDTWFVFIEPSHRELAERFMDRLQRSAPAAAERIVVLSGLKRSEYSVLAGCLDVLLDTLHFGSGISFYESIWTGTPMVTQEGPFLRSRYVAGGYRLMGLGDALVADTAEGMADLTIALLRDAPRREALRARIRAAAQRHLYNRMDVVHSFEAFAIDAIARARSSSPPAIPPECAAHPEGAAQSPPER